MELFSLLAKLTLDASQYTSALEDAQDAADSFDSPEDQKIELDNSDYTSSLDEAETASSTFSGTVKEIFSELKGALVGLGIASLAAGIVGTLREGVQLAKEHGDTIDKQSQKMGISAKAYQEWSYALELSGASIDDLNRGLRTWQQSVGDEEQTAKLGEAFEKLGIDANKAFQQIEGGENLDNLLSQTLEALADYKGGDRGAIAEALFGRGANGLNALLNNTAADLRDMLEEAHDLGMIMSDEEVKNAAAYADAITRLEGSLNGIKEAFAADLLPVLTDAANTVAKIVAFFNPRNGQKSLSDQWVGDDKAFADQLLEIEGTAAAANTLADKLLAMGDTSKMTAEQYEIWKGTAEELIGMIPSLEGVINTETGAIDGNTESIRENIKAWEDMAKAKALQELKEKKQQDLLERNKDLIDKTVEANAKAAATEKAKTEAYHKFSDEMKSRGLGELDFEAGNLDEQISNVMSSLAEMGDGGEADAIALGAMLKSVGDAVTEASKAQQELQKIQAEIDKAKQEYAEWEAAADAMFGSTDSSASSATETVNGLASAIEGLPDNKTVTIGVALGGALAMLSGLFSNAKGNWTVPYDNFPALLHRDEMVLTKSQARQYKEGGGGMDVSGAINNAVANAMSKVYVMMSGEKVGDLTTKRVRKNINTRSYNKLRAMGG